MTNYYPPLQPDALYHIYNRGNNGGTIFFKNDNYRYFLRKFDEYLSGYADVYAYALLPNHFHFLIKTKTNDSIEARLPQVKSGLRLLDDPSKILSEEFRRFFLSYAKSIKIQEERTGSLFEKNFKRKEVNNDRHLIWLINYIHRNPQTHGLINDFKKYMFSSYSAFLSKAKTRLMREDVLKFFGGEEDFIRFHDTNPIIRDADSLIME